VIAVDFSEGQEVYPQITEELQDLDIGILSQLLFVPLTHLRICDWI